MSRRGEPSSQPFERASAANEEGFASSATSRFTRRVAKPFDPTRIKLPKRRGLAGVLMYEQEEKLAALIDKRTTITPERREWLERQIAIKRAFLKRLHAEVQEGLRS